MTASEFKGHSSAVKPRRFRQGLVAIGLAAILALSAHAGIFVINAPDSLTTLDSRSGFKTSGPVHRVYFDPGGNAKPGTLTLTSAIVADTVIFENNFPDTSVVEVAGSLLSLKGLSNTTIVLRGMSFRLAPGASLIRGSDVDFPNHRLLIDSCIIMADSLNSTFLSWLGGPGSKVEIRRSMLVMGKSGPNIKIDIQADSVSLVNNLLNFEGVASFATDKRLDLTHNTVNRAQFKLSGNLLSSLQVYRNVFAFPPSLNRLSTGDARKFGVLVVSDFDDSKYTIYDNARFSSWDGFDFPRATTPFSDASNTSIAPISGKTDTTLWNWRIASDLERGAWNGSSPLPAHNLFPKQTTLAFRLGNAGGKDSVAMTVGPAAIPRAVSVAYGTAVYPKFTDSTRTLWLSDTTVTVTGVVRVASLSFPNRATEGRPMLFGRFATNFIPGFVGPDLGLNFTNNEPAAKIFIPAWAGQDTKKGKRVLLSGRPPDTTATLVYDSISRTGTTIFSVPTFSNFAKRQRPLLKLGSPAGLAFTTNAEGVDSIRIGIGKSGLSAFIADSISVLVVNGSQIDAKRAWTDSAGKVWTRLGFARTGEVALIERLGIGSGKDTVAFPFGSLTTTSAKGHHIALDSTFAFDTTRSSYLAHATQGLRLRWPGRAAGDQLNLTLKKTASYLPLNQKAYAWTGDSAISLSSASSDSQSVTVSLGLGDTLYPIFLAHAYTIPSLKSVNVKRGADSLLGLRSQTPGDIDLTVIPDSTALAALEGPSPKGSDTLRFLAGRTITKNHLQVLDSFSVILPLVPDSAKHVRSFIRRDTTWSTAAITVTAGKGRLTLDPQANAFAIFEWKPKVDSITPIDTTKPDTTVKVKSIASEPDTLFLIEGAAPGTVTTTFTPDSSAQALSYVVLDTTIAKLKAGTQGEAKLVNGIKVGRTKMVVSVVKQPGVTDTVFIEVQSPDRPDTLAVVPAKEPELKLVGDSLRVKPQLNDSEAVKLANFVVTVKTLTLDGKVTDVTSGTIAPTGTFAVKSTPGSIQVLEVTYESLTGRKSVASPLYAELNAKAITDALNSQSPIVPGKVWNLVGFPHGGSVQRDIVDKSEAKLDFRVWDGAWTKPTGDSIPVGAAVLCMGDSGFIPQVNGNPSWSLETKTIALKQGWNLVSSPLPFAIPEEAVGFDPAVVGWFNGLSWTGQGSQRKATWSHLDTLKPFQGFAVWSESPSQLVFNPKALFQSNPKKTAAGTDFKITLGSPNVGRYTLWMQNGRSMRQSPSLSFGSADPGIDWNAKVNVNGFAGLRFIRVVSAATDSLSMSTPLPEGMVLTSLASQNPPQAQRSPFSPTHRAALVAGDNWFVLGPKSLVHSFQQSAWLNPNLGRFKLAGKALKGQLPFSYGMVTSLHISRYRIDGVALEKTRYQDLAPGAVSIPLKSISGMTFVRLEIETTGQGRITQSLLVPGEAAR
jgi:hypothetical protein